MLRWTVAHPGLLCTQIFRWWTESYACQRLSGILCPHGMTLKGMDVYVQLVLLVPCCRSWHSITNIYLQTSHPSKLVTPLLCRWVLCLCLNNQEGQMPKNRVLCYKAERDPKNKTWGWDSCLLLLALHCWLADKHFQSWACPVCPWPCCCFENGKSHLILHQIVPCWDFFVIHTTYLSCPPRIPPLIFWYILHYS